MKILCIVPFRLALLLTILLILFPIGSVAASSTDCFGGTPAGGTAWLQHFIDGGKKCPTPEEGAAFGTSGADGVDVADFDGDCDMDIVTGWEESNNVILYLNPLRTPDGSPCSEDYVDFIDNDGDGQVDEDGYLLAANRGTLNALWPAVDVSGGQTIKAIEDAVFGDGDGDGQVDLIVSATEGGDSKTVYVHRFTGDQFDADAVQNPDNWTVTSLPNTPFPKVKFMRTQVGNINGDGFFDIIAGSKGDHADISWWAGPDFAQRYVINSEINWVMQLSLYDMDGDGDSDVLYGDRNDIAWLENPGPALVTVESAWTKHKIDTVYKDCDNPPCKSAQTFRWSTYSDIDGDGWEEIVTTTNYDTARGVVGRWYDRPSCPTFQPGVVCSWSSQPVATYEILVADDTPIDGGAIPYFWDKRCKKEITIPILGDEVCADVNPLPECLPVIGCVGEEFQRVSKAIVAGDVDADGKTDLFFTARGGERDPRPDTSHPGFGSGVYYLTYSGNEPPRCFGSDCHTAANMWQIRRVAPSYRDMKYDNIALIDFDMDGDLDAATVEENAADDKGLGVVWYENPMNHAPLLQGGQATVTSSEGSPVTNSGVFFDMDDDNVTIIASIGSVDTNHAGGTWSWSHAPADGPANQTVTLTASDDRGGSSTLSFTLSVNNIAPTIAAVSNNGPIDEGSSVTITVNASDAAGANDPLSYEFDCDNNGNFEVSGSASSATCTFSDNGNYTISVRVDDGDGGQATGSTNVTVVNVVPTISSISNDGPINEGGSANINVAVSDPAGVNDSLGYEFDCDNDGSFEVGPQSANSVGCSFDDNGSYTVNLRVSDDDGGQTESFTTVTVNNVSPTVNAPIINLSPVDVNQSVTAVATFSDPAGALDAPYTCTIDYGSGPQPGTINNETCSGPVHAYSDEGNYPVTIVVKDKDDGSGSRTATVTVTNLPPLVNTPVVNPSPSEEGSSVSASTTFSDGGANGSYNCKINYGDGSGDQPGAVSGNACSSPAYTYDDNGDYEVTITVIDKDGVSGSASRAHQVNNVAPMALFTADPIEIFVSESSTLSFSNQADPSQADTAAGFSYSYNCDGDDIWEVNGDTSDTFTCTYPTSDTFTARGHIADKDNGFTDYTATVTVLSLQQATQTLIDDVVALRDSGVLNQGQANSLLRKLENAIDNLNEENRDVAVNLLNAFINEVQSLVDESVLTVSQGQKLIDKALRITAAIESSS